MRAPPQIATQVLAPEQRIKGKWSGEVRQKWDYYEQIPHRVLACFGEYCGYSLASCKAIVRECFATFAALTDVNHASSLSVDFLGRKTMVSRQLWDYARDPSTSLHHYSELFIAMQEYAFGTTSERYGERIHKLLKCAGARGLRYCKPAYAVARMRRPQLLAMMENPGAWSG